MKNSIAITGSAGVSPAISTRGGTGAGGDAGARSNKLLEFNRQHYVCVTDVEFAVLLAYALAQSNPAT